jgi:diacylglycerol kinase family enzyme
MKKGQPWGRPATRPADQVVYGNDRALAAAATAAPGALIRFVPDGGSDLAAAVGLRGGNEAAPIAADGATELPMDVLVLGDGALVVNMLVVGTPPERVARTTRSFEARVHLDGRTWFAGRCTTVVVAVGQWRHGIDLVPRGHPRDGRVEVQAYGLRPGERRALRRRLATGSHLPHPRISTGLARAVEIVTSRTVPIDADGAARAGADRLAATVRPEGYRLLV